MTFIDFPEISFPVQGIEDVPMPKMYRIRQTYENNIGFFGLSKGAEKLKAQMQERIDAAKAKVEELKAQIRAKEAEEAQE